MFTVPKTEEGQKKNWELLCTAAQSLAEAIETWGKWGRRGTGCCDGDVDVNLEVRVYNTGVLSVLVLNWMHFRTNNSCKMCFATVGGFVRNSQRSTTYCWRFYRRSPHLPQRIYWGMRVNTHVAVNTTCYWPTKMVAGNFCQARFYITQIKNSVKHINFSVHLYFRLKLFKLFYLFHFEFNNAGSGECFCYPCLWVASTFYTEMPSLSETVLLCT